MRKIIAIALFAVLASQPLVGLAFENSRPLGCYDTLTIQRVEGVVFINQNKNTSYRNITGIDRAGGALAVLYQDDQPMSEKLKTQGLCEIYDYFPNF